MAVTYTTNTTGLSSLKWNTTELLTSAALGTLTVASATLRRTDQTTYSGDVTAVVVQNSANDFTHTFDWGTINIVYSNTASRLTCAVTISNTTASDILETLSFRLCQMTFGTVPIGYQFEQDWKGSSLPARFDNIGYAMKAGYDNSPAIITLTSNICVINFCLDTANMSTSVELPAGSGTNRGFFSGTINIAAQGSRALTYSLRMYSGVSDLFGESDVISNYTTALPFLLNWSDRRPIGMIFLASSGTNVSTNPNKWIVNGGNVDTTTAAGMSDFQQRILALAVGTRDLLLKNNYQGAITWDIEGQRVGPTYYGAPDRAYEIGVNTAGTSEMGSTVNYSGTNMTLASAYFKVFTDAGLKVGVTIRPQVVSYNGSAWIQADAIDENTAYLDMKASIQYAITNWGCSLFYLDSTRVGAAGSGTHLIGQTYEQLLVDFPTVLLCPENQVFRAYRSSAPLDSLSFASHGTSRTTRTTRLVWPGAFSVIMAPSGVGVVAGVVPTYEYLPTHKAQVIDGMKKGDIYMANCWFPNSGMTDLANFYKESKS